ncbi:hypothetical protein DL96DRAFT_1581698 [Flagelloscypha sp. PMI_526]|nr:hypothetical protein DL96DRAFT_1581698 [Flagelloscypha sp. PMI_526]
MTSSPQSLLDLPHELLSQEIFFPFLKTNESALFACAATSQLLRGIALPHIYSSIALASPRSPSFQDDDRTAPCIGDLENLADPDFPLSWTRSSQAKHFLELLEISPEIGPLVKTLRLVHGASGYEHPFWIIAEENVACRILGHLTGLESIRFILATHQSGFGTDVPWMTLPQSFKTSLWHTVNTVPTFRHLGFNIRFSFPSPEAFTNEMAISYTSSIDSLSFTCVVFEKSEPEILQEALIRPDHWPKLRALEIVYTDETVHGPLLAKTLVSPAFSVNVTQLKRIAMHGLNWADDWICTILDGQQSREDLEEVSLTGLFSLSPMEFINHFSRFASIQSLTLATDLFTQFWVDEPKAEVGPWAKWIKDCLPASLLSNLRRFILHSGFRNQPGRDDTMIHLIGLQTVVEHRCPQIGMRMKDIGDKVLDDVEEKFQKVGNGYGDTWVCQLDRRVPWGIIDFSQLAEVMPLDY